MCTNTPSSNSSLLSKITESVATYVLMLFITLGASVILSLLLSVPQERYARLTICNIHRQCVTCVDLNTWGHTYKNTQNYVHMYAIYSCVNLVCRPTPFLFLLLSAALPFALFVWCGDPYQRRIVFRHVPLQSVAVCCYHTIVQMDPPYCFEVFCQTIRNLISFVLWGGPLTVFLLDNA